MDRLQFVKSIEFPPDNDFVKCAIEYFDHEMLLYNLVGNCNSVSIKGDSLSPSEMYFSVAFTNREGAKEMIGILSEASDVFLYGKRFHVIASIPITDGNTVEIRLQKFNS